MYTHTSQTLEGVLFNIWRVSALLTFNVVSNNLTFKKLLKIFLNLNFAPKISNAFFNR